MRKRRITLVVCLILVLMTAVLCLSLNNTHTKYLKSFDEINSDGIKIIPLDQFDTDDVLYEWISVSHAGVVAEYIDFDSKYYCWKFKNIEVAFGNAPDEELWVKYTDLNIDSMASIDIFETGERYL